MKLFLMDLLPPFQYITRMTSSKSGRINLLLKQYYAQSFNNAPVDNPYELAKLEKLKTDSLMSKSVESLRSYKEAESELRMLLFNNCDKLLEAVQVVVSIRSESSGLIDLSNDLSQSGDRLQLITSRRNTHPETKQLQGLIKLEKTVGMIEKILCLPDLLKDSNRSPQDRLRVYLKVRAELFGNKFLRKYPLVDRAATDSLSVVESVIVPAIESQMDDRFDLVKLLLELYPESSSKRERIIVEYLGVELGKSFDFENISSVDNLAYLKHLLDLFFLGNELREGNEEYVKKIGIELLPKVSGAIVESLVDRAGDIGSDGKIGGEFIADCIRVHMRIPGIDMKQVEEFRKHAIENCIRGKFLAKVPDENLMESDVVHTQCCAVIVDVYDWLGKVVEAATELEELNMTEFAAPVVLNCVKEYYKRILVPVPVVGTTKVSTDMDSVYRSVELIKHVHNRHMISRTLNAVRDIFELGETSGSDLYGLVTECLWQTTRRLGGDIGSDISLLEDAVRRVAGVLDGWMIEESESTHSGSFRARMVTAMTGFTIRGNKQQQKLKELDMEETYHARRLSTPGPGSDVRRGAVFVLISMFLRTVNASGGRVDKKWIEEIIDEWFDNGDTCDMRQTIELMLKDCDNSDN